MPDVPSTSDLLLRIEQLEKEFFGLKESCYGKSDELNRAVASKTVDQPLLPLKAWFHGHKQIHAPCHLTWDEAATPTALTVQFSAAPASALQLDVTHEVRTITYTDPEQVRNVDPVVALVPKAASTSDRQITLQLDCRHPDWSGARYRALVEWFKARGKSVDIFPCRPLVAETMWDMAARAAQRHGDERTIVPPVDDEQRPSTGNDRASNVPSGDKNGLEPQNIRKTVVPTTSAPPDTQDINVPRGGSTLVLSSEPLKDRPSSNTGMITPGENVRDTSQGSEGQVPGTHAQLFGSLHGIAPTANTRISPPANRMSLGTSHRLLQSTNMRDASQPSLSWKTPPTKILPYSTPPGGLTFPFRNRTQDTLHHARGGNPFSGNTLTNWSPPSISTNGRNGQPPAKKARTDDPGVRGRKKVPLPKPNLDLSRRKLSHPDATNLMYVDEEYEDVGVAKKFSNSRTHPKVDFFQEIQGSKIKNFMTPKNSSSSAVATSSAFPNGVDVNTIKFLPIKAWCLGRKLFDVQESYHLIWESTGPTQGRMIIRSGDAPGPPSRHSEEVDLFSIAKEVWFGDPTEDYPNKVFVVETYEKTRRNKPLGMQYPEFFKQGGKHGEGDIVIKFDTSSLAWSRPTYKEFVDWLKVHVKDRQTIRGKAGDHKWDMATQMSQLTESRVKREQQQETGSSGTRVILKAKPKEPPVPGLPLLDDWSPPTSVAIANTAQPARSRPKPIPLPESFSSPVGSNTITTRSRTKRRMEGEVDAGSRKKE